MKVNLEELGKDEFEGKITALYVCSLEEWLKTKKNPVPAKKLKEFSNLDRAHICIVAAYNGSPIDGFFMMPQPQGYQKSNLKKFIERNQLPLVKLPEKSEEWIGKTVKLTVDKSGFLRLAV